MNDLDPKYSKLFPNAAAEGQRERATPAASSARPTRPSIGSSGTVEDRRRKLFPSASGEQVTAPAAAGVGPKVAQLFPNATAEAQRPNTETAPPVSAAPGGGGEEDSPLVAESRQLATELGLDDTAAQKVLEYYRRTGKERSEAWTKEVEARRAEMKRDPEIMGGVGALREAVQLHGEGDKFLEALGEAGDNPIVVRTLVRLAVAAQRKGGR